MPATTSCIPTCGTTAVTTEIPGSDGQSAFGIVLSPGFVVPAANNDVTVPISSTAWMVVGQIVVAAGPYNFEVRSIASSISVTLRWLDYSADAATGATIAAGAIITPSGQQATITNPLPLSEGGTGQITAALARAAILENAPLAVSEGGTSGATKAAAIAALGVGQDATVDTGAALAYAVTNAAAQITGMAATCPVTGLYLILARVTVLYTAVTFANNLLTLTVRNATAGSNITTTIRATLDPTTTDYPSHDYVLPFVTASLTASDSIQLWASLDVVESAGSTVITDASLALVPIAI